VGAPDRGDLVWLDFNPQAGHEQAGRRPALVLSPRGYHQRTPFAVVCPITSHVKGYPFEVVLPEGLPVAGAVLADQVKSVDRHVRRIEVAGRAPEGVVAEVVGRLRALLTVNGRAGLG
jgi:mRNA interferase MazF